MVYEQAVEIEAAGRDAIQRRRIEVHLDQPAEDGATGILSLSNLPASLNAMTIARLYRGRWSIDRKFHWLKSVLQSEIRTLGYPRAALFSFSVPILAFNILSRIRAAIESEHAIDLEDDKARLSLYHVAVEIRASDAGMTISVLGEA